MPPPISHSTCCCAAAAGIRASAWRERPAPSRSFTGRHYPFGVLDGDTSRVSIGRIEGGSARNAVPRELRALGEARTLLEGDSRERLLAEIETAFTECGGGARRRGHVSFDPHCDGYTVDEHEPLLRAWMQASDGARHCPAHDDHVHWQRRQRLAGAYPRLHRLHRRHG